MSFAAAMKIAEAAIKARRSFGNKFKLECVSGQVRCVWRSEISPAGTFICDLPDTMERKGLSSSEWAVVARAILEYYAE